ncbi:MAG: KpsF/GutQ family sugar-phosphate isomerase [Pseudomonas sp.]|nr:KpsF/GutQ family sugar-phosphate isomerase [Pseudomonas sp.]
MNDLNYLEMARQVFAVEAQAIHHMSGKLDLAFSQAVKHVLASKGRVVICGMGKSGIIGKKIAATLASTGTPSFFMHPGEAYHGDLGMVTGDDVFVAISNSGETDEVIKLIPFLQGNGNYLIALTGNPASTLAKAAHSHLDVGVEQEACPLQLAPTSSTTASLAMGDALAVTLMRARGFQPENFARFHPGGSLGRRLLRRVEDEMVIQNLPFIDEHASVLDVIGAMSRDGLGLAIIAHDQGFGVVTDGDIRRAINHYSDGVFDHSAADFMTAQATTVAMGTRVEEALLLMDERRITSLLVVKAGTVVGIFKK